MAVNVNSSSADHHQISISPVSLSFFVFLINEVFRYVQKDADSLAQVESRLKDLGSDVGRRMLEIYALHEKLEKREQGRIPVLSLISNNIWKFLFGKPAESLEKNVDNPNEYMIWENCPIYCRQLSMPPELGDFTVSSFTAGMVQSFLESFNLVRTSFSLFFIFSL